MLKKIDENTFIKVEPTVTEEYNLFELYQKREMAQSEVNRIQQLIDELEALNGTNE